MAANDYPLAKPGKVIGVPYQGTHGKAFNERGGSDNWESENAVDIATPDGTPVVAVADGTIGPQIGSLGEGGRFAGLRVHLVSGGNEFYYGHLSRLTVKAGEQVTAGQVIGYSGSANGVSHLHFAAKTGDPRQIFGDTQADQATGAQPQTTQPAAQTPPDASTGTAVTPPPSTPPPTALPTPTGGLELPGTEQFTLNRHDVASTWQQLAQQYPSAETQQFAYLSQLAATP